MPNRSMHMALPRNFSMSVLLMMAALPCIVPCFAARCCDDCSAPVHVCSNKLQDFSAEMPADGVDAWTLHFHCIFKRDVACTLVEVILVFHLVLMIVKFSRAQRRRRERQLTCHTPCSESQASSKTEASRDRLPTLLGNRQRSASFSKKQHSDITLQSSMHASECASLSEALHAYVQKGELESASAALKRFSQLGNPLFDDYKAVVILCVKKDELELALIWLRLAEERCGTPKTTVCYNAVMNAYVKRGDTSQAVAVAARMVKAGVDFDTVSYNTLIDAAARTGDADAAEAWMRQMLADGVKASVISFSSVMRACALAGKAKCVEAWLEQADKLGIELNMISYSAIINAFAKNQDIKSASAWLAIMMERGVPATVHCFTSVLHAVVHRGDTQHAIRLVEQMRAAGVQLDAGIYSLLISGALRVGDVHNAHSWANEAVADGIRLPKGVMSLLKATRWTVPKFDNDTIITQTPEPGQSSRTSAAFENADDDAEVNATHGICVSRRFDGIIKDFVPFKFGYIACAETHRMYNRDVFLGSQSNPEGFGKGQRVSFRLHLDKIRGFPRASDVRAVQVG